MKKLKKYIEYLHFIGFCHYMSPYTNREDYKNDVELRKQLHIDVLKTALITPSMTFMTPLTLISMFITFFYFGHLVTSKYIVGLFLITPNIILYFVIKKNLLTKSNEAKLLEKYKRTSPDIRKKFKKKAVIIMLLLIAIFVVVAPTMVYQLSKYKNPKHNVERLE